MMNIAFADRLIKLRKSKGLSQEELAVKLGVSRQAVSKWERAESSPEVDNLINLANLYGVTLDALLDSNEPNRADLPPAQHDINFKEMSDMDYDNGNGVNPNKASEYKVIEAPLDKGSDGNTLLFQDSQLLDWLAGCYPVVITLVYLSIGFLLDLWHPGWMLFLTIPMFYSYYRMCKKK